MGSKRLRVLWLALAVALLCGVEFLTATAQDTAPSELTLTQAIEIALAKNPQAALAQADSHVATANVGLARAELLPHFQFGEDVSRGDDPVYAFGTRLRQERFTQQDFALNALNRPMPISDFATQLSGSWKLFDWWKTEDRIHGAKLAQQSAKAMSGQAEQAIVLRVVESYQAVLYAQKRESVAQHDVVTAKALLHDAGTRVKAGLAVESDLLTAQVNLSERDQEEVSTEGDVDTAWADLEAAMGVDSAPSRPLAPIPARVYPYGTLADQLVMALKARPDLEALRKQQAASAAAVKAARADLGPKISTYGNWEVDRASFAGEGSNHWVAGVQLQLDILPLDKRARLEQREAARDKAAAEERAGESQIRLAVIRAWTDHRTAERLVQTAQAAMQQAGESLRILQNRYNAGLATMTDLLRAEDAQRQSLNDYWRAVYGNTVAYAELMYATGALTPAAAEDLQ